jgi:TRAP-type transport system periplasmic protein
MKKLVLMAFAFAALAVPAGAQTIELKMSTFLPPPHGGNTDFYPWLRDELDKKSGGRLKLTLFPGGSSFGQLEPQYDQAKDGAVDISHGLTSQPRGRFPRTSILDVPFLTRSADAASKTLWALLPKYLAPEYQDVKVLALHAHNGGLIHTRDKEVKTADDLKGLRLRTPSAAVTDMLKYLGADAVAIPAGQIYENLQKGTVGGFVMPWDPLYSFKLQEVTTYHLNAGTYTVSFFVVMNKRKYDGLPAEAKKAIDETTGQVLVDRFGAWWDAWDAKGKEVAVKAGNKVNELSETERAQWREKLKPMIDAYLAGLEKQGVGNAREIYAEAQKLIVQYEKK